MIDEQPRRDPASALVDPQGRPVTTRQAEDEKCPRCGAGPEKRVASGGFGTPWPVCGGGCSPAYEWKDEVFRGESV